MNKRKLEHIAFINFKRYTWSKTPKIKIALEKSSKFLKAYCTPSLSLLTIAGLTPLDIKMSYIDEDFEEINYSADYDIVALSAMTQQVVRAYEVAEEFRKRGVYVVIGGIHASKLPNEALQYVDTVIVGEAENVWKIFLNDFKCNKPNKIYQDNSVVDLKKSPVPRYDLLTGKNYFRDPRFYYNMVSLQATRGCPHDCEFCLVSQIYGTKIRKKSIDQVKNEILTIKKYFPNKVLLFADDNLFVDKKYAKDLMNVMKDLKVRWWAQTDISFGGDDELLDLAYESGCLIVLVGFESINPKNLEKMNKTSWKYRQLKNYSKYNENIQKHGIIVYGSFIFGLDSDTKDAFKNVIDFMDKNHITGQLTIATPLPGSRMEERLKNQNRLLQDYGEWDKCTFFDVLYEPQSMSKKELEDGFIWAYEQVFREDSFLKRAEYLKNIYKDISSRKE